MDPSAPSQPPLDTAYQHPSNPTTKEPQEQYESQSTSASQRRTGAKLDGRSAGDVPTEATPSSLAKGGHGERDDPNILGSDPTSSLEGEQMRAPGEGDIARANENVTGFGEQPDLAADMDRKRAEQDQIKEDRRADGRREEDRGVDVQGALGGGKNVVGAGAGSGGKGVA
ncbi:MAG: hypothetical protein Q9191_004528 [Dirinaria sp. TL-2023a]